MALEDLIVDALVRDEIRRSVKCTQLFIDGVFVDAVSGRSFATFDPSTLESIAEVAEGDEQDVDLAVQAARRAFDKGPWPRLPGAERGKIIYKFADLLEQNLVDLAKLESLDNGMPIEVSKFMIYAAVCSLRYNAGWSDKITGSTVKVEGDFHAYTLREPYGVVGTIIPWNFPTFLLISKVGPALVCGNTVVAKPAEQTPLTALACAKLAFEAGVPAGVFNVIPGYGPTAGAAIAKHMSIDKVSFTGSTSVGRLVMEHSAKSNLKPVTLELGGKSPIIVCEDADLDMAVELSQLAIFFNQGQVCTAGSRVLVHESIYDEFVKKAAARTRQRVAGDPFKSEVEHGPQINESQLEKIMSYIQVAKNEGARLVAGGERIGTKGLFVEPTIFADVEESMTIAKEEIFGPVLCILKFKTLEEAVQVANNTQYGLAAAVFTKDIDNVNFLTRSIRSGLVYVNTYFAGGPSLPFGGYKMSGIGYENGLEGLSQYLQTKSIVMPLQKSPWL